MENLETSIDSTFQLPPVDDALVTMTSRMEDDGDGDDLVCQGLQPSCPNNPSNSTPVVINFVPGYQLLEPILDLPGSYVNPAPFTAKKHFKLL